MARVSPARVKRAYSELWEKYGEMEEDFDKNLQTMVALRKKLEKKDELMENLKTILNQRDSKIEDFKARIFEQQHRIESRKTELELMERYMAEDRSAYNAALDTISMLKKDLQIADEDVRLRDYWFSANKELLEHVLGILEDRAIGIRKVRLGPREFKLDVAEEELEAVPEPKTAPQVDLTALTEALAEIGADENDSRIITKALSEEMDELLSMSENVITRRFELMRKEAMLARRALDRVAFGDDDDDQGFEIPSTGKAKDGIFTIAVNPVGMRTGEHVAILDLEEPEEYRAGLDIGLYKLSKAFNNGISRVLEPRSAEGVKKVRITLTRQGDEAVVMDNRLMLKDNNFLLGVYRGRTKGVSLVPGLVEAQDAEDLPPRLTEDEFCQDISKRIELAPEPGKDLVSPEATVATPEEREPHPYLGFALHAGVSYLAQYPEMTWEIVDVVIPSGESIELD